ncbi:MAG: DNA-binding protein [Bacteroidetes bacterium 4572_77]|nr:MAG: DNA-binding protein [Bacteroidetes bacterium 4572_77]
MTIFSQNIRLLRKRRRHTQEDMAQQLQMKRSTLSGYENQVAQPNMDALVSLSNYFNVSIDTLIKVELYKLPESQINQMERGYDVYLKGSKLRVLVTTVNKDNEENIELVPEKAKAGYTSGFADPEYIKVLPTFRLPFLSKQKKYRSFQISGDSMLPIPDGSYVTGEFVQNWLQIKNKQAYIIVTLDDGVVFKVIENKIKQDNKLVLHSLNPLFDSYEVEVSQIREMWRFVNYISQEIPPSNEMKTETLSQNLKALQQEVKQIQTSLKL